MNYDSNGMKNLFGLSVQGYDVLGLFLETLLHKLSGLLNNSIEVNLMLTSVITRLALYSHPLISSLLLNNSLLLQPSIPSLVQVRQGFTMKTRLE